MASNVDAAEHGRMIEAADDWGPGDDPERRWFLAGWIDEAHNDMGRNQPPEQTLEAMAAYNSGVVARRHDPFRQEVIATLQ